MMALLEFAQQGCEYAILEAGIGGRLDATNIIDNPICSVITSIGLDHTDVIGNTLDEIAAEKAGVIKQGTACIIGPTCIERAPIKQKCLSTPGSRLIKVQKQLTHTEDNNKIVTEALKIICKNEKIQFRSKSMDE